MTDMIDWPGGECPVAADASVDVRFRDGETDDTCYAGELRWNRLGSDGDIAAYRVILPAPSAADLAERDAEIARLTKCLATANANHEHFEREWYLRGDECDRLRAELAVAREALTFSDALLIARGCVDYGGGYRGSTEFDVYQHGIQTVIAALTSAADRGLSDSQTRALHSMGATAIKGES